MHLQKILRYIFLTGVLFGYMTEFPLFGGLTTRRLALLIALLTLGVKAAKTASILSCMIKSKVRMAIVLLACCLLQVFVLHTGVGGASEDANSIEFWHFIFIILYIPVFALFCAVEFKDVKEFALVWVAIMIAESLCIYVASVNSSFRLYLYQNMYIGDGRFEKGVEWGSRIVGVGIASATGSLIMSTACLTLIVLKIEKYIKDNLFYICYDIVFIGTLFIGRTGVLVEVALFIFYTFFYDHSPKKIIYLFLIVISVILGMSYLLMSSDTENGEALLTWMLGAIDEETIAGTVRGMSGKGFPPFSIDTILGTGLATGYSYGGHIYSPDSGYIRMWICMGILGFTAYYCAMYMILSSPKLKYLLRDERRFIIFAILLAFVVEWKEPFMMKYIYPWAVLTITLLILKDRRAKLLKRQ